jgi:hypothetical protein
MQRIAAGYAKVDLGDAPESTVRAKAKDAEASPTTRVANDSTVRAKAKDAEATPQHVKADAISVAKQGSPAWMLESTRN